MWFDLSVHPLDLFLPPWVLSLLIYRSSLYMMELDFCLFYELQMLPPDCHLVFDSVMEDFFFFFFFFGEVKFVSISFYGLWILCHA